MSIHLEKLSKPSFAAQKIDTTPLKQKPISQELSSIRSLSQNETTRESCLGKIWKKIVSLLDRFCKCLVWLDNLCNTRPKPITADEVPTDFPLQTKLMIYAIAQQKHFPGDPKGKKAALVVKIDDKVVALHLDVIKNNLAPFRKTAWEKTEKALATIPNRRADIQVEMVLMGEGKKGYFTSQWKSMLRNPSTKLTQTDHNGVHRKSDTQSFESLAGLFCSSIANQENIPFRDELVNFWMS
jgi:hypothetical protein